MIDALVLCQDLIERRREIRLVLGCHYEARVAEWREALIEVAKQRPDKSLAEVALEMGQKLVAAGADPAILLCAFVEEAEARGAA